MSDHPISSSPMVSTATDARVYENEHTTGSDALPLPLGVKLTVYRLLNMSVVFTFGLAKAILTYMGQSVAPTTLDWISGALLAVALYWIGLYETADVKNWEWFFHIDLTPAIIYSFKRFVGGVFGVIFALHGTLTVTSLSSLPFFLLAYLVPRVSLNVWSVVYVCFAICVQFFWFKTRRLRARAWVRRYVMDFLDVYGLGASLVERYEWLGGLGATLGFFCGMAFVWLPLGIAYVYLS
ncbi:hypothetical protein B0F90DRAFT_830869 [Multifurca ochricompacta]|uniref:Uncharacterized protein n=1 Tax=Multifurca ochricompacta TaxID=376703 RepID=A0AAD4M0Y8_9AGAM|nr:hypothetical protein B0F90DRAFT_830869 [Multifurca ochricompacta]